MSGVDIPSLIFPWRGLIAASRNLRKKIKDLQSSEYEHDLDYMDGYKTLNVEQIESFYSTTLEIKSTIEAKLQGFLFSVAIGVTILTSSLALLYGSGFQDFSLGFKLAALLLIMVAVLYMLLGGMFAIMTLGKQVLVYTHSPSDMSGSEEDFKESIAVNTELNSLTNILRQNYLYVSLHCIINSICLVFTFFLLVGGLALGVNPSKRAQSIDVRIPSLSSDLSNLTTRFQNHVNSQDQYNNTIVSDIGALQRGLTLSTNALYRFGLQYSTITNSLDNLNQRLGAVELSPSAKPMSENGTQP